MAARSCTSVMPPAYSDRIWSFLDSGSPCPSGASGSFAGAGAAGLRLLSAVFGFAGAGASSAFFFPMTPPFALHHAPAPPQEPFQTQQGDKGQEAAQHAGSPQRVDLVGH